MRATPRSRTSLVRILAGYHVDPHYSNAQHVNERELLCRLDPDRFHVTAFYDRRPDERLLDRPNTRLLHLPPRLKTLACAPRYFSPRFDRIFYLAPEPVSYAYLKTAKGANRAIATIEGHRWHPANAAVPPLVRRFADAQWQHSQYLISLTPELADYVFRHTGRRSTVIPLGVDTGRFRPAGASGRATPCVLFLASLKPRKRPEMVLEAAARFPDARFRIAGEGELQPKLAELISARRLGNVELLGPVAHSQTPRLFDEADVLFLPSLEEGLPKVTMEASAAGVPSVIFGRDYDTPSVLDGQTGLVAKTDEELLDGLGRLLSDGSLRAGMG
ncbi:MAG TPA: glycosyltransferase family 4 protein, partial [Acidimicrobiales bacterium]|nr:glycosyltransferase family 4 protein [Acidimicrobiales bacterium]